VLSAVQLQAGAHGQVLVLVQESVSGLVVKAVKQGGQGAQGRAFTGFVGAVDELQGAVLLQLELCAAEMPVGLEFESVYLHGVLHSPAAWSPDPGPWALVNN